MSFNTKNLNLLPKILVVDDDQNFLFAISRTLVKAGFEVFAASDAHSAIQEAQRKQPDLIILDVNLPRMNGFDLKHVLNQTETTRNIPTVFLSAIANKAYLLNGLSLAQDYLTKPIDSDILIAKLRSLLSRTHHQDLSTSQVSIQEAILGTPIYEAIQITEVHDYGRIGHTLRVTYWFIVLAKRFGITGRDLENGRKGALLHDIGKLAIPGEILNKPGPLTTDEWNRIRKHPEQAIDMLKVIPAFADACDIPYYHHERWDGQGYPKGLKGEAIPLPVRVFSLVDTYDVLHIKRPYKAAVSKKQAMDILLAESGRQFDPKIVSYFISNIQSLEEEVNNLSITNDPLDLAKE